MLYKIVLSLFTFSLWASQINPDKIIKLYPNWTVKTLLRTDINRDKKDDMILLLQKKEERILVITLNSEKMYVFEKFPDVEIGVLDNGDFVTADHVNTVEVQKSLIAYWTFNASDKNFYIKDLTYWNGEFEINVHTNQHKFLAKVDRKKYKIDLPTEWYKFPLSQYSQPIFIQQFKELEALCPLH